jgi:cytosine/adenosine deaminase-related metal-dependent hydrolase
MLIDEPKRRRIGTPGCAYECLPFSTENSETVIGSATTGPAEFLGLAGSLGTVEAGKSSDLVLLDADPLQDIRSIIRIVAVIRQGRLYDAAALTRLLNRKP